MSSRFQHLTICGLFLLSMSLVIPTASARVWQDGIQGSIGSGSNLMVYRYYLPADYSPDREYPLILALHGSGGSGTDYRVEGHFNPLIATTEHSYPAIVLYPQLPTSSGWNPGNSLDRTDELLADFVNTYSVDTNRLYISGLSMGGYGTMTYLQHYNVASPGEFEFSAAAPLSGAWVDSTYAPDLVGTPIWMVHGDQDTVVPPTTSRSTYRTIAGLEGGDPIPFGPSLLGGPTAIDDELRYTEINGLGHSGWSTMYSQSRLIDWMFLQTTESLTGVVGDINQDGFVTEADYHAFLEASVFDTRGYDKVGRTKLGDLNLNGRTDRGDTAIFHQALVDNGLGYLIGVPEPSSLTIALLAGIVALPYRRRSRARISL